MNLEVRQEDPRSVVRLVKTFEELNLEPRILQGIYATGFKTPSKILGTALPLLLAEPPQNLIAQSQSGTGETIAFVVAMLSLVDTKLKVLCMLPTYELAIQTAEVIAQIARLRLDIKLLLAVSGEFVYLGENLTDHIIVGAPGKILDWGLKHRIIDLKKIRIFILDEADVMISEGHPDISIRIHKELSGLREVLITTNVLARGIDVEEVTVITNFNLPKDGKGNADCETYLHRIGRTGRFGKNGIALNIIDSEKAMNVCHAIEDHYKKPIKELKLNNFEEITKSES
uniref:RNA helicase n=1 Tax=Glossina palpalis gambiensis TaxID=67801 RepID=A0A1B0B623_9MUSC